MKVSELLEFKKYSNPGYNYKSSMGYTGKDPDRGPHAGKELEMLLDGVKPAALVSEEDYKDRFEQHVKAGKLIAKKYRNRSDYDDYVVALPGEERRLDAVVKLLSTPWDELDSKMSIDTYHARLGRLLGYTKDQVRKFIDDDFNDAIARPKRAA